MNQMDDLMLPVAWMEPNGFCATFKHESYQNPLYTADQMSEYAKKDVEVERKRHRMQLAGISTAALGYWKEGDSIHPDYDTPALRDVAKLYAKIIKLHQAALR